MTRIASAVFFANPLSRTADSRPDPTAPLAPETLSLTALHRIAEQCANCPTTPAIVSATLSYTYHDLNSSANATAAWLHSQGLVPGDLVAVHSNRSPSLVPVLLGVWQAGLAFLVVDASYPDSSILERLRIARAKAWIDVDTNASAALSDFLRTHQVARTSSATLTTGTFDSLATSGQLAYLAFTSGSTGTPRAVLGAHFPLPHFVNWQIGEFGLNAQDRFSMLSGIGHDPLLRDFLTPLSLGATLHVPSDAILADPREFACWMDERQITVAHITPARAQVLLLGAQLLKRPLTSLRYLFFGGETLPPKLVDRCHSAAPNVEVINFYGATETPQAMGFHRCDRTAASSTSISIPLGRGIRGVQLLVVEAAGKLCEIGEEGEVWIRTPYLSQGYLNDPAATRERFIVNPFTGVCEDKIYRTGDLGVFLPDGQVEFRRRQDRQLKVRGFRVEPREIETAIESHPSVQRAIVLPIETPHGAELAACFVTDPPNSLAATELKRYLATRLPKPLIPSRILNLDTFPLTPNGKVDRAALEALTAPLGTAPDPAASPFESWLTDLWTSTLGLAGANLDDNFFDLGGTSLAAATIVAEVERKMALRVPLALLLEHPTIHSLTSRLQSGDLGSCWELLIRLKTGDSRLAPLFLVHAIGGNVIGYRDLAHLLGDRTVYAVQSPALHGDSSPDTTIEDMAAHYVREIRKVQPHGPYELGGYSAGGLVAFEMAQQLRTAGETVGTVCLLDTLSPLKESLPVMLAGKIRGNLTKFGRLSRAEWSQFLATKQANLKMNLRVLSDRLGVSSGPLASPYQAEVQFRLARRKYRPKQYIGAVALFQTIEEKPGTLCRMARQWASIVPRGLTVHSIQGNHETMLTRPNVDSLARSLRAVLEI